MKTQLLEDIAENTPLSFAPSKIVGDSKANKEVHKTAPPQNAEPAKSRSAPGVWRQKPAEAPPLSPPEQPDHQPTPVELNTVFEEIAALEAQFVPPSRQPAPAIAPVEPSHESAPAEPVRKPAVPQAATLAPHSEIAALEAQIVPPSQQPAPAIAPVESPHEPTPARAEPVRKPAVPRRPRLPHTRKSLPWKRRLCRQASSRRLPLRRSSPSHEPPPARAEPVRKPAVPPAATLAPNWKIAALEAQFVPPRQQPAPAIAPVEPRHEPPPAPAEPVRKPAVPLAAATLSSNSTQGPAAPRDPLFDLTPWSAPQTTDPFTPAPTGLTRSRQRYLLLAAGVLSGVLLILGGQWFYQERNDAQALALAANQTKEKPQTDKTMEQPAVAAKELEPEPDSRTRPTSAAPASEPAPAPPPLVMLEREPVAEPEPVAERAPATPLPKPSSSRRAREQSGAAVGPARKKSEREPVRQVARASGVAAEKPPARDSSMDATLKACRERGYDAAQCVKRACSMTRYGFVCRGR
jgi:hypothetical protein